MGTILEKVRQVIEWVHLTIWLSKQQIGNLKLAYNDNLLTRSNKLENLTKRSALVETHPGGKKKVNALVDL